MKVPKSSEIPLTILGVEHRINLNPFDCFNDLPLLEVRKRCIEEIGHNYYRSGVHGPGLSFRSREQAEWFENTIVALMGHRDHEAHELAEKLASVYFFTPLPANNPEEYFAELIRGPEFILHPKRIFDVWTTSKLIFGLVKQKLDVYHKSKHVREFFRSEITRWLDYKGDDLAPAEEFRVKRVLEIALAVSDFSLTPLLTEVKAHIGSDEIKQKAFNRSSWFLFICINGLILDSARHLASGEKVRAYKPPC